MYLGDNSDAIWTATSYFLSNSAQSAGAVFVVGSSNASWSGKATFSENLATGDGGALYLGKDSSATWIAALHFVSNDAQADGGAVYASNYGNLLWSMKTLFIGNTARYGGAMFVTNGVSMAWNGDVNFTSNRALVDGGAVGSRALDSELSTYASGSARVINDEGSIIVVKGSTNFVNNTCGVNGGGMALVQSLDVVFESDSVMFLRNNAGLSGGAVFVAATGMGTVFKNVIFVKNYAQIGGGVHASGSGTVVVVDTNNEVVTNPTTFEGCFFDSHVAHTTGGAVDSASGEDAFLRTIFKGNQATLGGALRLAGTASVDNCSFDDNVSELGGGPAVSNVGYMSNVTNSSFKNNVFSCDSQTFLDFNVKSASYPASCSTVIDTVTIQLAVASQYCRL